MKVRKARKIKRKYEIGSVYKIPITKEINTATRVQILDETDCISHSTNTLGKGMNPVILPLAMGK